MLDRVFLSEQLEALYRIQLAKDTAVTSARLIMILSCIYLLAMYRLSEEGLTFRLAAIMCIQLSMVTMHAWAAFHLYLHRFGNEHFRLRSGFWPIMKFRASARASLGASGKLAKHTPLKASIVFATLIGILLTAVWLRDEEVAFRGPLTTGLVRASVITFQQFPLDIVVHMHGVSWLVSLFIALNRLLEKHLPEPYNIKGVVTDLAACTLLATILPIWFSARIEAANRKRFLHNGHPTELAEHQRGTHSLCSPFWSKVLLLNNPL